MAAENNMVLAIEHVPVLSFRECILGSKAYKLSQEQKFRLYHNLVLLLARSIPHTTIRYIYLVGTLKKNEGGLIEDLE